MGTNPTIPYRPIIPFYDMLSGGIKKNVGRFAWISPQESRPPRVTCNIDMKYVVQSGEFEVMVGSSSRDQDLQKATLGMGSTLDP